MTLADAIRRGSKYRPQVVGDWIGHWGGSCAMGAAYEGAFGFNIDNVNIHAATIASELSVVFPILNTAAQCPECDHTTMNRHLSGAIACLNDSHGWSREEIADWVETIENTCKREHEEEQPVPIDPTKPETKTPERELVPA